MAANRNFPLTIIFLALIKSSITQPGSNPAGPLIPAKDEELPPDDYYDIEDEPSTVPPKIVSPRGGIAVQRCDYNPCTENQPPCSELSAANHCLCPGFTSHLVAPEAPYLKSVAWNGSDVVVRWCAPLSYVTAYSVTVGGKERQRFGRERRRGGVGPVENFSEVCVVALNNAGDSEASCVMYQPKDHSLPLKAGLIGGALGLLMLLLVVVLLWRRRRQRKLRRNITASHTAGT
ncbi:leucine-rich repeat neuronal protein 4 [Nerophis lumbriciformis]|uniref:leucine-rich repeat neuronal protein 4 n=1 Tax=Nerophis lumbriciformis TaxID=546530 RepID=UPI002AE016AD|nr:leucine-rich repeat neuronal protein 4-like [Nerophis lumbriciformis]